MSKRKILLALLLITVIACIAFLPSLNNGFVNWDDEGYILNNPAIRSLSFSSIKHMFTSVFVGSYVPLTILSFAANYHFAGLAPFPYHATNLLLHFFNVMLVFFFVYAVSRKPLVAIITSLLFAVHPLRVESVAWVTERKDVLYGLFFLSAVLAYIQWRECGRRVWYYSVFAFFVLSFLSKPAAVSFPLVLLCCEYYKTGKMDKTVFKDTMPFFVLALVFALVTILTQHAALHHGIQLWMNALVASRGLVFYLEKTLVPINLSCLYPFPKPGHIPVSFFISPFIVAGCVWLIVFSRRYTRAVIFGSLFFLAAILPSLQIVSWGNAIAADRFTYLPCIGFSYIAAEGFSALLMRKQWRYNSIVKPALTVCLIAVIFVLMSLTWQRCQVWKDSLSLWSDAIKQSSSNAQAYNNRGLAYQDKGNYDQAILDYTKAIEINPHYDVAYYNPYYNRGNAYITKGNYDQAISDYTKVIEINPGYVDAYNNRGNAYISRGKYDQAISDYTKAIEINPGYADTYYNRGIVYIIKGRYDQAILDCTRAIEINPRYAGAYYNRAKCYYLKQDYDKTWDDVHRAQSLGYSLESKFINKIKKASGREK